MCDALFMNECNSLNNAISIDTRQKVVNVEYPKFEDFYIQVEQAD
jgi:hypothetical protein